MMVLRNARYGCEDGGMWVNHISQHYVVIDNNQT